VKIIKWILNIIGFVFLFAGGLILILIMAPSQDFKEIVLSGATGLTVIFAGISLLTTAMNLR